jgi:dephospho-CoA kinase
MLIGVTGTLGAGKGTVASYLSKKGFRHAPVSAFLAEEARRRGIEPSRVARRDIGNEYRAKGAAALIEEVLSETNPQKEDIVVESLHTVAEVKYVQGLGGTVVAVDAPLQRRWERIQKQTEGKGDASYEAFVAEQDRQMASDDPNENNLRAAMESADYRIENAGSEEELFEKIDGIVGGIHD